MTRFRWLTLAVSVSLLGSQLTGFGLGVAILAQTRSTTLYGLLALATVLPQIALAPLAGVLVDRFDRRRVLLAGQLGAGACSLALLLLYGAGALSVPAMVILQAAGASFLAAQFPAVSSATALLVPKERLGRANGLAQLGLAIAQIAAPALAGFVLPLVGTGALLTIDFATFLFAATVIAFLRIPNARQTNERAPFLDELSHGWRHLRRRRGLLAMLVLFAALNFGLGSAQVLIAPLVLGFADARALGIVLSTGGLGMLAGSGVMLAWGGPRRRVAGVLAFALVQGACFFLGAARPSTAIVALGAFGAFFAAPLLEGTNEVLWQRKVPRAVQGRVFAFRATIPRLSVPVAFLCAGALGDRVGAARAFVLLGAFVVAVVGLGSRYGRLRNLESEIPDSDQPATAEDRPDEIDHRARQLRPQAVH